MRYFMISWVWFKNYPRIFSFLIFEVYNLEYGNGFGSKYCTHNILSFTFLWIFSCWKVVTMWYKWNTFTILAISFVFLCLALVKLVLILSCITLKMTKYTLESCGVNTAPILKYIWPFFNMHERIDWTLPGRTIYSIKKSVQNVWMVNLSKNGLTQADEVQWSSESFSPQIPEIPKEPTTCFTRASLSIFWNDMLCRKHWQETYNSFIMKVHMI